MAEFGGIEADPGKIWPDLAGSSGIGAYSGSDLIGSRGISTDSVARERCRRVLMDEVEDPHLLESKYAEGGGLTACEEREGRMHRLAEGKG